MAPESLNDVGECGIYTTSWGRISCDPTRPLDPREALAATLTYPWIDDCCGGSNFAQRRLGAK
jgi:hypothetical protein